MKPQQRLRFDGDPKKAETTRNKHRVSFTEAASVFRDPLSVTIADTEHSATEDPWHILGFSEHRQLLVVTFTERPEVIRIISARRAMPDERGDYEENIP